MDIQPLTSSQRELVERNMHLVRRHLAWQARFTRRPRREREMEDLYQEGYLGLIQAARTHDPAGRIPFEAYALKRIHHAVSLAIHERFTTINITAYQREQQRQRSDPGAPPLPTIQGLEGDPEDRRAPRGADPSEQQARDEAFRQQFHSAVQRLRTFPIHRGRSDQAELIDILIRKRILIPNEPHKTSLRQIARDTKSSYARVAACEKRLLSRLRKIMEQGDAQL